MLDYFDNRGWAHQHCKLCARCCFLQKVGERIGLRTNKAYHSWGRQQLRLLNLDKVWSLPWQEQTFRVSISVHFWLHRSWNLEYVRPVVCTIGLTHFVTRVLRTARFSVTFTSCLAGVILSTTHPLTRPVSSDLKRFEGPVLNSRDETDHG